MAPLPAPFNLTNDLDSGLNGDRHDADDIQVRAQLHRLIDDVAWADLNWPDLITALLSAGRTDIPLSRLLEGHADGLRILAQAGATPVPDALYGVWASRSERTGVRAALVDAADASRADADDATVLRLDGTIRFASGLGVIDRALVPAWTGPDHHLLLDLDLSRLDEPTLEADTGSWSTPAMAVSRSHTLTLRAHAVPASSQIGPANFYLDRPQFFPGGVGVAACWLGGAARIADLVQTRMRPPVPPHLHQRLGTLRAHLAVGSAALHTAAEQLHTAYDDPAGVHREGPSQSRYDGRPVSAETRWAVAAAVEAVLDQARHIAGPAGLAFDRDLTRAVQDLGLYVLQFNPDTELSYLAGLQEPARSTHAALDHIANHAGHARALDDPTADG